MGNTIYSWDFYMLLVSYYGINHHMTKEVARNLGVNN